MTLLHLLRRRAETDGEYTLIEIDLGRSGGPPLHYHNAFSETFEVKEGVLYLQTGKRKRKLILANRLPFQPEHLTGFITK